MSTSHKNALLMDYLRYRLVPRVVQPGQRPPGPGPRPMSMKQWFGVHGLGRTEALEGGVQ